MEICTIRDFKTALRQGPYVWPGGYRRVFILCDGAMATYAAVRSEYKRALREMFNPCPYQDQWRPVATEVYWEGPAELCAISGEVIESECGDPEADESEAA